MDDRQGSVAIVSPLNPPVPAAGITLAEQALLQELAAQFGPVLLQFFQRRVGERNEAQDLTQEVYVRLLKRGNLSTVEDMRRYVFEVAASVLTDRARRRRSHYSDRQEEFDPLVHANAGFRPITS